MSRPALYVTQGSYGEAWVFQALDEMGEKVDLTDATAAFFSMRLRATGAVKFSRKTAEVGNGTYTLPDGSIRSFTPADGVLIYRPNAGDSDADVPGAFEGLFEYTLPAGPVRKPGLGYLDINIQPAF
ncbi:hypothetical protein [Defluviimonas sp. SAOS-178_SWC]|uniref:hypothetical protein n=1 Tax=Defluviimonas sp. SAOS-178_SWC TaxID=3121287 RepID=UPI0032216ED5